MSGRSLPQATGWGTQRRLQALATRGWSSGAIGQATGIPAADITAAITDPQDTAADLSTRVAQAYNLLWDRQPPQATPHDQVMTRATRAEAERNGWAPPMAWDDEVIDLPDSQPAQGWKPPARPHHRAADLVEDAEWVRSHDGYRHASVAQVAARLGVTWAALAKAHERVVNREAEAG